MGFSQLKRDSPGGATALSGAEIYGAYRLVNVLVCFADVIPPISADLHKFLRI